MQLNYMMIIRYGQYVVIHPLEQAVLSLFEPIFASQGSNPLLSLASEDDLSLVCVPTNNQSGQRSGPCRLQGDLYKARHIVDIALLVRFNVS